MKYILENNIIGGSSNEDEENLDMSVINHGDYTLLRTHLIPCINKFHDNLLDLSGDNEELYKYLTDNKYDLPRDKGEDPTDQMIKSLQYLFNFEYYKENNELLEKIFQDTFEDQNFSGLFSGSNVENNSITNSILKTLKEQLFIYKFLRYPDSVIIKKFVEVNKYEIDESNLSSEDDKTKVEYLFDKYFFKQPIYDRFKNISLIELSPNTKLKISNNINKLFSKDNLPVLLNGVLALNIIKELQEEVSPAVVVAPEPAVAPATELAVTTAAAAADATEPADAPESAVAPATELAAAAAAAAAPEPAVAPAPELAVATAAAAEVQPRTAAAPEAAATTETESDGEYIIIAVAKQQEEVTSAPGEAPGDPAPAQQQGGGYPYYEGW